MAELKKKILNEIKNIPKTLYDNDVKVDLIFPEEDCIFHLHFLIHINDHNDQEHHHKGANYNFCFEIPKNYPDSYLRIRSLSKVYHPNFSSCSTEICFNMNGNKTIGIALWINGLIWLLHNPHFSSPLNDECNCTDYHKDLTKMIKGENNQTRYYNGNNKHDIECPIIIRIRKKKEQEERQRQRFERIQEIERVTKLIEQYTHNNNEKELKKLVEDKTIVICEVCEKYHSILGYEDQKIFEINEQQRIERERQRAEQRIERDRRRAEQAEILRIRQLISDNSENTEKLEDLSNEGLIMQCDVCYLYHSTIEFIQIRAQEYLAMIKEEKRLENALMFENEKQIRIAHGEKFCEDCREFNCENC